MASKNNTTEAVRAYKALMRTFWLPRTVDAELEQLMPEHLRGARKASRRIGLAVAEYIERHKAEAPANRKRRAI